MTRASGLLWIAVVGATVGLGARPAHAVPVVWTLYGVTFEDGGTASGSFTFDADTLSLVSWSIMVSGGNETDLPPVTYASGLTDHSASVFIGSNSASGKGMIFEIALDPPLGPGLDTRQLRIDPLVPLTNAGGTLGLDLANSNFNVECYNCGFPRLITAGVISTVPEPGVAALAGAALACGLLWRRREG